MYAYMTIRIEIGKVLTYDSPQEHGRRLYWSSWRLSPDMKYMLVKADTRKVS